MASGVLEYRKTNGKTVLVCPYCKLPLVDSYKIGFVTYMKCQIFACRKKFLIDFIKNIWVEVREEKSKK